MTTAEPKIERPQDVLVRRLAREGFNTYAAEIVRNGFVFFMESQAESKENFVWLCQQYRIEVSSKETEEGFEVHPVGLIDKD